VVAKSCDHIVDRLVNDKIVNDRIVNDKIEWLALVFKSMAQSALKVCLFTNFYDQPHNQILLSEALTIQSRSLCAR